MFHLFLSQWFLSLFQLWRIQISKMKLNADLVVLSACETGYGQFEQGEGIISIARTFMYAGVPSLVVSLWQVNDVSTAKIMNSFYLNLADAINNHHHCHKPKERNNRFPRCSPHTVDRM